MSLIIDALKKAQQLRLNESEGAPVLKYSYPNRKKMKGSKKQWIVTGVGIISACIILIILLKPASPRLATETDRATLLSSFPGIEKISSESSREAPNMAKVDEPFSIGQALNGGASGQAVTKGLPNAEGVLNGRPPQSQKEKRIPEIKASLNKNTGESPIGQATEKETLNPQKMIVAKKSLPSLPLSTQKEEASSKSIGVEQEGEKDRAMTSDVLTQFNLGVQFYNQREFSKAIQAYQKVIELDPTYVEAYNNLGIIYQMIGDVDRAFGAYQKSTEINPRYEKGYNNLGILLFLKGRYDEAFGSFQKALAVNPYNIECHINLGILFKKKDESEKAIECYQKALAINPFHKETHYNIALLYEQLENLELAINHYQQFIQLSSKSHPELVLQVKRHLYELAKTKNK